MQWHRHDRLGLVEQAAAAARQPAGEGRREVEPVAMLEREDRALAGVVVAHHRARLVVGRRLGVAGAAQRVRAGIEFERRAAAGADRSVEELDLLPAIAAERPRLGHRPAAADAGGRIDEIERGTCRALQALLQSPAHRPNLAQ